MSEDTVVQRGQSEEALPAEVTKYLDTYTPATVCTPERWREIGPVAREITSRMCPLTQGSARMLIWVISKFFDWLVDNGIPIDPLSGAFTVENINLFAATRPADQRSSMRSRLRTVACRLGFQLPANQPKLRRRPHLDPYTAGECESLVHFAGRMRTEHQRRVCEGTLLLGLGCGLTGNEILAVRKRDVTKEDGVVVVRASGRAVACRAEYEERLWSLAQSAGDRNLVGINRLENMINALNRRAAESGSRLSLRLVRLRTTWLVGVLSDGVPIPVVMKAAGLSSAHAIHDFLSHVPETEMATAHRLLRGENR